MAVATLPRTAEPTLAVLSPAFSPSRRRPARPPARVKLGPVGRAPHHGSPTTGGDIRLTRRGALAVWAACLAAVALIVFGLAHALEPAAPAQLAERTVTVLPGQTAWQLAEAVNPTVDPRVTLAAVERLNGLDSVGVLQPGQRLVVPVFDRR